MASNANQQKALLISEVEVTQITCGQATPFKKMPSATRVPLEYKSGGKASPVRLQFSNDWVGWSDALTTKFGIGPKPKFDNPNAPDKWTISLSMEPGMAQFNFMEKLQQHLIAQGMKPENKGWFRSFRPDKIPGRDRDFNPIMSAPKIDEMTGKPKYPDWQFKAEVFPKNVDVRLYHGKNDAGKAIITKGTWEDVKPYTQCMAMVTLSHMYVTGAAWGATFYLDTVVCRPSDGPTLGLGGMNMGIDFVEAPPPSLEQAMDTAGDTGDRPALAPPMDMDDMFEDMP